VRRVHSKAGVLVVVRVEGGEEFMRAPVLGNDE
jgi:hypothetical protein